MRRAGLLVAAAVLAALGGCVSTSEMPLARNVWQIHMAFTTDGGGGPMYAPTKDVLVTVAMFRADEPQAAQALDAAAVLQQVAG